MDYLPSDAKELSLIEQVWPASTEARSSDASSSLHEDVLTHLTKSAVISVSEGLHLTVSQEASTKVATWISGTAKTAPLFVPGGSRLSALAYGAAAVLYGASETKWGDSADNLTKDALLGGLKGVGMKAGMEWIGRQSQTLGLAEKFWAAPATGVAFGVSSTLMETGLSRSTYYDESGQYRGLGYGLGRTAEAVGNVENLVIGAATFTLGAAGLRALQAAPIASALPELIGSRVFQSTATGFSFGAFSGMAEEAHRQVKAGGFKAWEINKFDYGQIGKQGLFQATSDALGATLGAKFGAPSMTVEEVPRIDKPASATIRDHSEINDLVELPFRKAVTNLWDKNIRTVGSGMFHGQQPKWTPARLGSAVHVGEYEPPYYRFTIDAHGQYQPANVPSQNESNGSPGQKGRLPYIVLDDLNLSPQNQLIARKLGRLREDAKIEIQVPVQPGAPAKQVEEAMLGLAEKFQLQPMTWGYKTPLQFYRQELKVEAGVPSDEWISNTVNSADFKQRGLVYDPASRLIFASKELAAKYEASPPVEPSWYRGPENFGGRGGWQQAYIQAAVRLYTPAGQHLEAPDPATARKPDRSFDLVDLARPENADYYLASKNQFFELFGTRAYDALADRHWLELRNAAFESVEKHWPMASVEKDRATMLGTTMLARAAEGLGHFPSNDAWLMKIFVPEYLWREPSGRHLSAPEVIDMANRIYDDMDKAIKMPFDHTFGRQLIDHMLGPDGDKATDSFQFRNDLGRTLDKVLRDGWDMQIHPKYVPLLQEILQKQGEGLIPDRFDKAVEEDGLFRYTPVYRSATTEEKTIPLSELVKNLKIVDYGFRNQNGPVLGKVSLASHDVHDHARAFWVLDKAGLFRGTDQSPGYRDLMSKLTDPVGTGIFKREGELVSSVATDWRSYFDLHPSYDPSSDLGYIRNYFIYADSKGVPLSKNQASALAYVEEILRTDPDGKTPRARKLRHIIGGVWSETLEQKRKTENTLWQRSDGTYQRMSVTNPEYLAFVIDAARILDEHGAELWYDLNQNNLKMERYLRSIATPSSNGSQDGSVPKLHYSPEDITRPQDERAEDDKAGLPRTTRDWLMQHPGFNTRRAPIRDWLIGYPSEFDQPEVAPESTLEGWRMPAYGSSEWRRLVDGP